MFDVIEKILPGRRRHKPETIEWPNVPEWESSSKPPLMKANNKATALMTFGELTDEARTWSHLRRNALTSLSGTKEEYTHEARPMTNWTNHYHTPESWENTKDILMDGKADKMAVNLTLAARKNMLTKFKDYIEEDNETVTINPIEMIDLFRDKYETHQFFEDKDIPGIPTLRADEFLERDQDQIVSELGDGGEYGFVAKPRNGSGGDGVEEFNSLNEVEHFLEHEAEVEDDDATVEEEIIVQPKIPHDSDLRVITVGDKVVNAERRFSPDGELCTNLSQIDGEINGVDMGVYGKALKAYREGRVEPINVDVLDEIPDEVYDVRSRVNNSLLSPESRNLTDDIIQGFDGDEFNFDESLDRKPFKVGMDFLEVDEEDIGHLPDRYQEKALNYSTGDTAYLAAELNGNPGSMADLVARWASLDEQVTTLHVNKLMEDIAGYNTKSIEAQLYSADNNWKSVKDWYPTLGEDYMDRAYENSKEYTPA